MKSSRDKRTRFLFRSQENVGKLSKMRFLIPDKIYDPEKTTAFTQRSLIGFRITEYSL